MSESKRHHPGDPPLVAMAEDLPPAQLMAIARAAQALAQLPAADVDDDIAEIHDLEREADFAARQGDNEALIDHLLLIAARALHAVAQLDAADPPAAG